MLKKLICTFLILWLPLLLANANIVAAEMQIASSIKSAHMEKISMDDSIDSSSHVATLNNKHDCCKQKTTQQHCVHCDLCLNFAYYSTNFNQQLAHFKPANNQHIAWVADSHLDSPNHRPPITA